MFTERLSLGPNSSLHSMLFWGLSRGLGGGALCFCFPITGSNNVTYTKTTECVAINRTQDL